MRPHLDAVTLEPLVRRAFGEPAVILDAGWSFHPLRGGFSEDHAVYRVAGSARVDGGSQPWAFVLKVGTSACLESDPQGWDYPLREALVYGSGLLDQLPGPLVSPQCFAVTERPDGSTWLWLEEVVDDCPGPWSVERHALAAYHLGQFNGAYLTGLPVPNHAWLARNWLRAFVSDAGPTVTTLHHVVRPGAPPLLRRCYPPSVIDAIGRLWAEREVFLGALDRLPQTFCHRDAHRRNLRTRRGTAGEERFVAIDWAFAGPGPVGEDLVALVMVGLLFFEAVGTTPAELDAACFGAYVDGLRAAGWHGDARLVRLGYAAALALRCPVGLAQLIVPRLGDPATHQADEESLGRPMAQIVAAWADEVWPFTFDLAEAARALLPLVRS